MVERMTGERVSVDTATRMLERVRRPINDQAAIEATLRDR